jgi:NTE family protein
MKHLIILILILSSLIAKERPKIALVLSGGGARGGAHVGVLKVLEKNNIPVDMIVGTSMGSLVGGLYASGRTPQEIEDMLLSTDWYEYIRTDYNRRDIPIRRKQTEYKYQGRLGLGVDETNQVVTPTGVLKREPLLLKFMQETAHVSNVDDFDKLPIPFRAVATNIRNGEKVVLKSGKLANAIYASSAIPGGLQPINIDGVDLIDGGISSNLPVEVALDMGADIIIAVDVSEHFEDEIDVNSYIVVMSQLVNILMRKNANKSISRLKKQDILLTPKLDKFSGLDVEKYKEIIDAGEKVAQQEYASKLAKLSVDKKVYLAYKEKHHKLVKNDAPIIDEIKIENSTYLSNNSILKRLHVEIGKPLDDKQLRADMLHIYNMMIFDRVDYKIVKKDGKNILVVMLTPSWDNHGEIRFSIGVEDDFSGSSNYSMKLGYTMFGINAYAGEWKTDLEIGRRDRAYTEIFQPIDPMQRFYVRPSLMYEYRVDEVPVADDELNYRVERYGSGFGFGSDITTNNEIEVGTGYYRDELELKILGDVKVFHSTPLYAYWNYDDMDNLNFPNKGVKSYIRWEKEMPSLGGDYDHEQIYLNVTKPYTYENHNITARVKYGNTYSNDTKNLQNNGYILDDKFVLGGLFNLSGYEPYSQVGNDMFLGMLRYRYKMHGVGFFGSLNTPLYLGAAFEMGSTWDDSETLNSDMIKNSSTLYMAADTFLGPFYFAYSYSDEQTHTFYLFLGEKF